MKMVPGSRLKKNIESIRVKTELFLRELIRFRSLPGCESEAMEFIADRFAGPDVNVQEIPLSDSLKSDPEYSSPIQGLQYEGRHNLRVVRKGTGDGRAVILNAHVDVVPAPPSMRDAFSGATRDGSVHGRGACDNKGSIASIYALLHLLQESGAVTEGDLIIHLVVEEENGGNGSLAMIRRGESADGCVVMEPTHLKVLTSVRGAVWFRIELLGTTGHSGQAARTRSALLMAHEAISVLSRYHEKLLAGSRGIPLFDEYENPMPVTFGHLTAGDWPASAPGHAVLEGVLGFLPNKKREEICAEMRGALLESQLITPENLKLEFTYRHDCSVTVPEHALVKSLLKASSRRGAPGSPAAMPASCDAWLYNNLLDIPTVVFGPGSLQYAHSGNERISMKQVELAGKILFDFITDFCGEKT